MDYFDTPYRRIVLMHVIIIISGVLLGFVWKSGDRLSLPAGGLVILILLKTLFDLRGHMKEHFPPEAPQS